MPSLQPYRVHSGSNHMVTETALRLVFLAVHRPTRRVDLTSDRPHKLITSHTTPTAAVYERSCGAGSSTSPLIASDQHYTGCRRQDHWCVALPWVIQAHMLQWNKIDARHRQCEP